MRTPSTMGYRARRLVRHGGGSRTSFDNENYISTNSNVDGRRPSVNGSRQRPAAAIVSHVNDTTWPSSSLLDDRSLTALDRARTLITMTNSTYSAPSHPSSHLGYTPLRTHYAFGSSYHRDTHSSHRSYTPVARIDKPFAYVRPLTALSARFEYNYPTAYISKAFIAADDDTMPIRSSSLRRSHSGCGGWTALAGMDRAGRRARCYPASDYAREPQAAMANGALRNANATVDRLELERLTAKVATLEADKAVLRDRVDTLERELKFKQMDLDQLRSGGGGGNPEAERELKTIRKELATAKEVEATLRAELDAVNQSLGGNSESAPISGAGDLESANAEIASLTAIKQKLESDMQALQAHMVEAIEDLAKPSEGELAAAVNGAAEEDNFEDAVEDNAQNEGDATEEAPAKGKPFLKGSPKTKQ